MSTDPVRQKRSMDLWRGNEIYECADGTWRHVGDASPVAGSERPCGRCHEYRTAEGHDPCLGALPGVVNACCGHGERGQAYIQFANGVTVRGFDVVERPSCLHAASGGELGCQADKKGATHGHVRD